MEPYSDNKRHDGTEVGTEIFEKLREGKYTTVEEVRQRVEKYPLQVQFWTLQNILWYLITCDTSTIDSSLVQNVLAMSYNKIQGDEGGPQDKDRMGPAWEVAQEWRPIYWSFIWNNPSVLLFHYLWDRMSEDNMLHTMDTTSLFWILNFAIYKNYLVITKKLWNLGQREELTDRQIILLLRKESYFTNIDSKIYIINNLEVPRLLAILKILEEDSDTNFEGYNSAITSMILRNLHPSKMSQLITNIRLVTGASAMPFVFEPGRVPSMFQCITYLKPTLSRIIESLEAGQVKTLISQFQEMDQEESLKPILNNVSPGALSQKIYILGCCIGDSEEEKEENQQLVEFIIQSLDVQSIASLIIRLRQSDIEHIQTETLKLIAVHMQDTTLQQIIGYFKGKDDVESLSLLLKTAASCLKESKLIHALRKVMSDTNGHGPNPIVLTLTSERTGNTALHCFARSNLDTDRRHLLTLICMGADVSVRNNAGDSILNMSADVKPKLKHGLLSRDDSDIMKIASQGNGFVGLKNLIVLGDDDLCLTLIKRIRHIYQLENECHPIKKVIPLIWEARDKLPQSYKELLQWEISYHGSDELQLQSCCKQNADQEYNLTLFQNIESLLPKTTDFAYYLSRITNRAFLLLLLLNFFDLVTDITLTAEYGLHDTLTSIQNDFPNDNGCQNLSEPLSRTVTCLVTGLSSWSVFIFALGVLTYSWLAEIVIVLFPEVGEQYLAIGCGYCCSKNLKAKKWWRKSCIKVLMCALQPFATQVYEFYIQEFVAIWINFKQPAFKGEAKETCAACEGCNAEKCICTFCGKNAGKLQEELVLLRANASYLRGLSKLVTASTEDALMPLLQLIFLAPYITHAMPESEPDSRKEQETNDITQIVDSFLKTWRFSVTATSITLSVLSMSVALTELYFSRLGKAQYKSLKRWLVFFASIVPQVLARLTAIEVFLFGFYAWILSVSRSSPYLLTGFVVFVSGHYFLFGGLHLAFSVLSQNNDSGSKKSWSPTWIQVKNSMVFAFASLYTITEFNLEKGKQLVYWKSSKKEKDPTPGSGINPRKQGSSFVKYLIFDIVMVVETIALVSGAFLIEEPGLGAWKIIRHTLGLLLLGLTIKSIFYLYLHPWTSSHPKQLGGGLAWRDLFVFMVILTAVISSLTLIELFSSMWIAILISAITFTVLCAFLPCVQMFRGKTLMPPKMPKRKPGNKNNEKEEPIEMEELSPTAPPEESDPDPSPGVQKMTLEEGWVIVNDRLGRLDMEVSQSQPETPGDGDCFIHAIYDQMLQDEAFLHIPTSRSPQQFRNIIVHEVDKMVLRGDMIWPEDSTVGTLDQWKLRLLEQGAVCDQIFIQGTAEWLRRKIRIVPVVFQGAKNDGIIVIQPSREWMVKDSFYLLYFSEAHFVTPHYQSIKKKPIKKFRFK